jgi:hypothetical protein
MDQVKHIAIGRSARVLLALSCLALGQTKEILVLRPAGTTFDEARKGIAETLGPAYTLRDFVVDKATSVDEVVASWKHWAPKLVVAMDNHAIALFRESRPRIGDSTVPLVALMGVRVDAAVKGQANAAAINYEIPAVTTLVNLRAIVKSPVKRAGMIYRASMEDVFRRNAEFCKTENIELVGREVPDNVDAKSGLETALKSIASDPGIDALVVINDNFFLNGTLLKGVWLPLLSDWKHPVIVGVESLVRPELRFGTFAVLPDHYALGSQAAGLIQEIEDAGWKVDGPRVDQPISVIKVLNMRGFKGCCEMQDGKTSEIDKVLE